MFDNNILFMSDKQKILKLKKKNSLILIINHSYPLQVGEFDFFLIYDIDF